MSNELLVLLIAFQLKHFICDYPLQNQYMLGKFKDKGWTKPLSAHCFVHALFTFVISLCFLWSTNGGIVYSLLLSVLDFIIHFIQDRIKASPKLLGRFKPDNKFFWWALGQDQMTHHLTHYLIIYILLR